MKMLVRLRMRRMMARAAVWAWLFVAAGTASAADIVQIAAPTVQPATDTEIQRLDTFLERAANAATQLSEGSLEVTFGKSAPAADYRVDVVALDQPPNRILTITLTRRSDGKQTEPFVFMSDWGPSLDVDIAHAIVYLRSAMDGFADLKLSAPPEFLAALTPDMLSSADLGYSFPLRPTSISVEPGSNIVFGTSVAAVETDRYFREIRKPGKELYTSNQVAYAYDVQVSPAGTIIARPAQGGTLYTLYPDATRPAQVRTGIDIAGSMAVLDDGSVVVTDAAKPRAVRVSGRKASPFTISTNPNAYSFAIAAGPDNTVWNWDYSEGRIHIISAGGAELEALVPMLPADLKGRVKALRVDAETGGFYLLTYDGLWKFRRDGRPIWRLDEVSGPSHPDFSSIFSMAIDPSLGLIYLLDISNGTVYELIESGSGAGDPVTAKLLSANAAIARNPDDIDAYFAKAAIYHSLSAPELERAQYDAILEIDPNNAAAESGSRDAGAAVLRKQAAAAADLALRTLRDLGPVSAQPAYTTASGLYEKLIAAAPGDSRARSDLARLKQQFTEQNPLDRGQPPARISSVSIGPVFPSLLQYYRTHPAGSVTVENRSATSLSNVVVSVALRYLDFPSSMPAIASIPPGESVTVPVLLPLSASVLDLQEDLPVQAEVSVKYDGTNNAAAVTAVSTVAFERNTALTWDDTRKLASFITPREQIASSFAFDAVSSGEKPPAWSLPSRFFRAMKVIDTLGDYGIQYVEDPASPFSKVAGEAGAVDTVRFARTTLRIRSGDCDDTTALLGTLLEAAAVPTAIMTSPGHVFLAFDTGEPAGNAWMYESTSRTVIPYAGTLWIPIETTALSRGFYGAWETASGLVRRYYGTKDMEFLPTETAQETYPPVPLPAATFDIVPPPLPQRDASFASSIKNTESALYRNAVTVLSGTLSTASDDGTKVRLTNEMGILHARFGDLAGARSAFQSIVKTRPDYVPGYINLANIEFLQKDYPAAMRTMERARGMRPDSTAVNLVLAQIASASRDTAAAADYLSIVRLNDPKLAERYAFLGNARGTTGGQAEARASNESRGADQSGQPDILWSADPDQP